MPAGELGAGAVLGRADCSLGVVGSELPGCRCTAGVRVTVCWRYREAELAGSQDSWSCCSATGTKPLATPGSGRMRHPCARGLGGCHASPTDYGSLCSSRLPASPVAKNASEGGASHRALLSGVAGPEGVWASPLPLHLWRRGTVICHRAPCAAGETEQSGGTMASWRWQTSERSSVACREELSLACGEQSVS